MSRKMRGRRGWILIISNHIDQHANIVEKELRKMDERVFRFDTQDFAEGKTTIVFSETGKNVLRKGKTVLDLKDVKSVWVRRPFPIDLGLRSKAQGRFGSQELTELWGHLYYTMPNARWVSERGQLTRSSYKYVQLITAQEVGLDVPRTCMTNSASEAKRFIKECGGKVIYKSLKTPHVEVSKTHIEFIPTTILEGIHHRNLPLLKNSGGIFQEYIEKQYELRVTVVGDHVFAAKMDTQKHPLRSARIDWRNAVATGQIFAERYKLPKPVANRLVRLIKELGLRFGAIDMIRSKDGRYVFLEVNPSGQWLWTESQAILPISKSIARLLAHIDY